VIKKPSETQIVMRQMVMPGDTNVHGTIFGGTIMSWMDIAAAMVAQRHCESPVVTVHISDIDFISPIKLGYHVKIMASLNFVGTSSMTVGVRVDSENPFTGNSKKCTKAYLTFVALDEFGKPLKVADLAPETEDEKRRYKNAQARRESAKALKSNLK